MGGAPSSSLLLKPSRSLVFHSDEVLLHCSRAGGERRERKKRQLKKIIMKKEEKEKEREREKGREKKRERGKKEV